MSKQEIVNKLMLLGRLSDEKMYTYTNAKQLPGGRYGYCIVSMTKDTMYITDVEGASMKMGELLWTIPVAEMTDIKHSPRITLNHYLKFKWKGEQVILGAVTAEMKKVLGI